MKRAPFGPEWLERRLAQLLPGFPAVSLCVALSGGVDSITLLAALSALRRRASSGSPVFALRAIHIHHGLHANADRWSAHCRALAKRLSVPIIVKRVEVSRAGGASGEAAARDARYSAIAALLQPGEVLLTAHHEDDQFETVLLQLLRGAGIPGLAAMPDVAPFAQGLLARPLLARSRAELETWAREQRLTWVEDDSNANEQLDRNYLRRSVVPLIRARWPEAAATVSRSARHAAEARRLLDLLARADVGAAAIGKDLSASRLRTMEPGRRRNALRYWIARAGFRVPDTRRLEEISGALLAARPDSNPHVQWNGTLVRRHGDTLSIARADEQSSEVQLPEAVDWDWRATPTLRIEGAGGTLNIVADPQGPLDIDALPPRLSVRRRSGGERLRPHANSPTRALKSLLQEARVPLTERDRVLLIFDGEKLVAVSDRWIDASVRASSRSTRRGRFRWQPD